jgi:hypothetical protein
LLFLSKRINVKEISDNITIAELLSIDGSIIVGVLIFLTLGPGESAQGNEFYQTAILTSTIVFPFAISALVTLTKGSVELGIKFAIPGFIYLMVSIVMIAYSYG